MQGSTEVYKLIIIYVFGVSKQRTLHGRVGIRILSSSAESMSHLFALLTNER